jgi:hypothetical protein
VRPLEDVTLADWAERNFERFWQQRDQLTADRGKRSSRDDVRLGYVACLIDLRVSSAFTHPEEVGL